MQTVESILEVLHTIPDPEMPISIVDLGIIEHVDVTGANVSVAILPTFVGCPALPMIEEQVRQKLEALPGVRDVKVSFIFDPAWTVDRITEAGRDSLREHGVTVPERGSRLAVHDQPQLMTQLRTSAVPCPFCSSSSTYLDSPFGPTRCRMIYYCEACRNSFEHMRRV